MALEMRRDSGWFYGRIAVNGKRKSINLGVQIKGKRPSTLRAKGDALFERARGQAEKELHKLQVEGKQKRASVEILQTIHEARTGERAGSILLRCSGDRKGMFEAWKALPRKRRLSQSYVDQIESLFERFIEFLEACCPDKRSFEMSDVRKQMARHFMASEEARGVSGKTYNNELIALRSTFKSLADEAAIFKNPFEGIPTKEEETVFRKPFSIDELSKIVEIAGEDRHAFIRPIIYTGICTAMRRGDCCLLSPCSVDFEHQFLKVRTGKTRKTAQIPLFPLLQEELKKHAIGKSQRVLLSRSGRDVFEKS